jgi:hypothetical protein
MPEFYKAKSNQIFVQKDRSLVLDRKKCKLRKRLPQLSSQKLSCNFLNWTGPDRKPRATIFIELAPIESRVQFSKLNWPRSNAACNFLHRTCPILRRIGPKRKLLANFLIKLAQSKTAYNFLHWTGHNRKPLAIFFIELAPIEICLQLSSLNWPRSKAACNFLHWTGPDRKLRSKWWMLLKGLLSQRKFPTNHNWYPWQQLTPCSLFIFSHMYYIRKCETMCAHFTSNVDHEYVHRDTKHIYIHTYIHTYIPTYK